MPQTSTQRTNDRRTTGPQAVPPRAAKPPTRKLHSAILRVALGAACLGWSHPVYADDIGTARVSPDTATVGDRLDVTLEFVAPADYRLGPINWPYPPDTLVPLDTPVVARTRDSLWRVRQQVALFATGGLAPGPIGVMLFGPAGDSLEVLFPPDSVQVLSVLPAEADSVQPIGYKGLIEPPVRIPLWVWFVVGAALLLILYLIWYLRRPRQMAVVTAPPARPPWEVALESLSILESEGYHTRGEPRPFAITLSEILRRYLEHRYGFVALEQTTSEIKRALGHAPVTEAQTDAVLKALQGCDLAKYAKFHWPGPELGAALTAAKRFVNETTPHALEETVEA